MTTLLSSLQEQRRIPYSVARIDFEELLGKQGGRRALKPVKPFYIPERSSPVILPSDKELGPLGGVSYLGEWFVQSSKSKRGRKGVPGKPTPVDKSLGGRGSSRAQCCICTDERASIAKLLGSSKKLPEELRREVRRAW